MSVFMKIRSYRLEFVNFMVGAVILTFELVAARAVTPYIGNTIYTWTSIIGVILAALALGYWYGGKISDKRHTPNDVVALLCASALLLLVVNVVKDQVLVAVSTIQVPLQWQAFIASSILFSAPTFFLGALSPYLTRLSIVDIKTSGQRVARMSAYGTAGCLLGTFLTGYVLFGYFGTDRILYGLVLVLLALSFTMSRRHLLVQRGIIIAFAIFGLLTPSRIAIKNLVEDTDTKYNRVIIRDVVAYGKPTRVLMTDAKSYQSGVALDGSTELIFPYARAFAYSSKLKKSNTNSLVIGGGAFTFPQYLAKTYQDQGVDIVEIDDKLLGLSKKYFEYEQSANSRVFSDDARAFLNSNKTQYSTIYVDAYSPHVPPFQLASKEAIEKMRGSLSKDGIVVANVISARDSEPLKSIYKTYSSVFSNVSMFPASSKLRPGLRQNIILVASDEYITKDEFMAAASTEEEKIFATNSVTPVYEDGLVLTDDYAPIDRLAGYR